MKKKVLQVTTISNTINTFLIPQINMLQSNGYTVDIACSINDQIQTEQIVKDINIFDVSFQRSPLSKENIRAYKSIKKIIEINRYDIVHVHTPVASAITRLAIKNMENQPKIVYTAHGFHFYDGAPLKNWVIFYPIEKYLSKKTDVLITINNEDYDFSRKKFNTQVKYLPGVGINLDKFKTNLSRKEKIIFKKSLGLREDDFVLTCIGELNQNKNQKFLIDMMSKCNLNIKLLLVGIGGLESELVMQIDRLNISDKVKLLGYRDDIQKLLEVTDILVTASHREGLPVNIIEGMSMGLPIISIKNRGVIDLVQNGKNGFIVSENIEEFLDKIYLVLNDEKLKMDISSSNIKKSRQYGTSIVNEKLLNIYENLNS